MAHVNPLAAVLRPDVQIARGSDKVGFTICYTGWEMGNSIDRGLDLDGVAGWTDRTDQTLRTDATNTTRRTVMTCKADITLIALVTLASSWPRSRRDGTSGPGVTLVALRPRWTRPTGRTDMSYRTLSANSTVSTGVTLRSASTNRTSRTDPASVTLRTFSASVAFRPWGSVIALRSTGTVMACRTYRTDVADAPSCSDHTMRSPVATTRCASPSAAPVGRAAAVGTVERMWIE